MKMPKFKVPTKGDMIEAMENVKEEIRQDEIDNRRRKRRGNLFKLIKFVFTVAIAILISFTVSYFVRGDWYEKNKACDLGCKQAGSPAGELEP